MTIEQQLKDEILSQYKSIRAFTMAINVPYSTVDTMLKRGLGGASVVTVLKVCMALNIDIEGLFEDRIIPKVSPQMSDAIAKLNSHDLAIAKAYHDANEDDRAVVDAALRKYYDCPTCSQGTPKNGVNYSLTGCKVINIENYQK